MLAMRKNTLSAIPQPIWGTSPKKSKHLIWISLCIQQSMLCCIQQRSTVPWLLLGPMWRTASSLMKWPFLILPLTCVSFFQVDGDVGCRYVPFIPIVPTDTRPAVPFVLLYHGQHLPLLHWDGPFTGAWKIEKLYAFFPPVLFNAYKETQDHRK